jgi:hypothetical protein
MLTQRTNSTTLPLIMGINRPSAIQEADEETIIYDELHQVVYDARTVGTKSLKSHFTLAKGRVGTGKTDKKNEIDDSKTVK